jgi:threonine synthase
LIEAVTDDEILEAYQLLANPEGVFVEPASAASLAGVIKKNKEGYFGFEKVSVVCTLTGNGLKDPDNAIKCAVEPVTVENDMQVILQAIGI